ncbi:thiamine phosphate synthase [Agreia sp. Leaf210]|uniref:thiamine phosphate synthase n=1 Tax=Agreia sp. Leaf210 TaxID=1735682 RepID=UPI0006F735C9|nr:thiamine phosphate synthase [Agreia sp. Leaf210]KQM57560.1 thiamine-phosphate diphosphorylase [Agreia sp. Leaf210]
MSLDSSLDLSLYLVTDTALATAAGHPILTVVREAVAGGVTVVQLREKNATAREFLDLVCRVADAVPDEVAVIVNDRVDVFLAARRLGASVSGMHLGQSDLPPALARELIGPDAVLGLSASTTAQLLEAENDPGAVDYVGIGALHATTTKTDAPRPLGIEAFAALAASTRLPAVAIGGIGRADIAPLRRAGAAGAAVVSAICSAPSPGDAARELASEWRNAR